MPYIYFACPLFVKGKKGLKFTQFYKYYITMAALAWTALSPFYLAALNFHPVLSIFPLIVQDNRSPTPHLRHAHL